jgi:hypothetical protein
VMNAYLLRNGVRLISVKVVLQKTCGEEDLFTSGSSHHPHLSCDAC